MQRDRTLMPAEALRLAALGILVCRGRMTYGALATEVRLFTASYGGSPVDVMSSSIELLRFEGLIAIAEQADDPEDVPGDVVIVPTDEGRSELWRLLQTAVKPSGAYARLLMALRMRFIHLLDEDRRALQVELLIEGLEGERARLLDLRRRMAGEHPDFLAWLDRDIDRVRQELAAVRRARHRRDPAGHPDN
ncbi:MAG: hypothetical protein GDA49_06855 [Rhodospirillales bacterium]|nr:hypothetical protein [Rhodospirillales bacterium]